MKNPAIRYGILGAILIQLYHATLYFIDKALFLNPFLLWLPIGVYVLLMWKAALDQRTLWGNVIDFRSALRTAFIVFLLTNLGYYFFVYGVHLYDPELLAMEAKEQISYLQKQLDNGVGDPQEANTIRKEIDYITEHGLTMALGTLLMRMAIGAIGGFTLAALIGFLVKTDDVARPS